MILSTAQRKVLEVLRPQRSEDSYFAGSLVISPSLQRRLGDFDVHHRDWQLLERSLTADRAALARAGAEDLGLQRLTREYQGWHRIADERIEINWVLDLSPLMLAPRRHPQLGFALHPWDVIAKKMATAVEEDDPKHGADLALLLADGFPLATLADQAARLLQGLNRQEAHQRLERLLAGLEQTARAAAAPG